MPIDFAIQVVGNQGQGEMTFDECMDLGNNVYLSIMTPRGSFFQDPNVGMNQRYRRAKNTVQNMNLVAADAEAALAWLISSGRATAISVIAQIVPPESIWRLKLDVQVTQAQGQQVTYTIYTPVGPTLNYMPPAASGD
jgi:phage gp46-like protein